MGVAGITLSSTAEWAELANRSQLEPREQTKSVCTFQEFPFGSKQVVARMDQDHQQ